MLSRGVPSAKILWLHGLFKIKILKYVKRDQKLKSWGLTNILSAKSGWNLAKKTSSSRLVSARSPKRGSTCWNLAWDFLSRSSSECSCLVEMQHCARTSFNWSWAYLSRFHPWRSNRQCFQAPAGGRRWPWYGDGHHVYRASWEIWRNTKSDPTPNPCAPLASLQQL